MKRKNISTALAMLLAAGSLAYAQEQQQPQRPARQNPEVFTGVVINGDNSVTFRYKNPKAVKVEVSGEFMEGSAQLVEKDGIWTYTTAPLASEMYFYTLSVDGSPIVDMNYSMTKDIPRWMNYFIIGGEK